MGIKLTRLLDCPVDRCEERGLSDRLQQISCSSGGNAPFSGSGLVMCRDDNCRNLDSGASQMVLELQPGHVRHLQVDDHAFGKTGRQAEKKLVGGLETLHIVRRCFEEPHQGFPDGRIVIHDCHSVVRCAHPANIHERAAGSSSRKSVLSAVHPRRNAHPCSSNRYYRRRKRQCLSLSAPKPVCPSKAGTRTRAVNDIGPNKSLCRNPNCGRLHRPVGPRTYRGHEPTSGHAFRRCGGVRGLQPSKRARPARGSRPLANPVGRGWGSVRPGFTKRQIAL